VLGVDQSAELIECARQATPVGITYLVASAVDLAPIADASFDGVLCQMALMDIEDLHAALRTVERILLHFQDEWRAITNGLVQGSVLFVVPKDPSCLSSQLTTLG
jgi:hypothetical protein